MLSARHSLSLCVATCFDHRVWPISAKCLKNNVWTADKSKMLHLVVFTENEGIRELLTVQCRAVSLLQLQRGNVPCEMCSGKWSLGFGGVWFGFLRNQGD